MTELEKLVFTPAQQRELHVLFGRIPNCGSMGLRTPFTFDDLCENLRRMGNFLERHGRWDAEDRKELNKLRRQQYAVREYLGLRRVLDSTVQGGHTPSGGVAGSEATREPSGRATPDHGAKKGLSE